METNVKQDKPSSGQKEKANDLSAQQIQKRRKMLVYPLFILAFIVCMWLILSPQGKDKAANDGFNSSLPSPQQGNLIFDKREAYEQEDMKRKEQEKLRSLDEFSLFAQDEQTDSEREERLRRQERMAPKPVEYYQQPSRFSGNTAFQSSAAAYEDVNRQLGSFYSSQAEGENENRELRERVEELERRLVDEQTQKQAADRELALIEKSYEIASRYMGGQSAAPDAAPPAAGVNSKNPVQPVRQLTHRVVSLLAAPVPDSIMVQAFMKPRNLGFITATESDKQPDRNSIRACVYRTVTVTDGAEVSLRLLDAMLAGDYLVPRNTVITGVCRINGERLSVEIGAIQHGGNIIPVELKVYGLDGCEGVSVPGSDEINAVKEIAANMGSGLGSSITISDDASSQLLADLGRSAIQGVSQYASKKIREVKVTLKEGYEVLLMAPRN